MQNPDIQSFLSAWGLSSQAISILSKESEIVADLQAIRKLPPFPPGYVPTVVEVLFDDIPYIRSENGVLTYVRNCRPDYEPPFVEYRFDNQTAVFQVGGEYVINRTEGIAQVAALQSLLR